MTRAAGLRVAVGMVQKVLLAVLITVLLAVPARPAPGQPSMLGARAAAMGGAAGALADDIWGRANPAAWASIGRPVLALSAAQLYGMPELKMGAARAGAALRGVRLVGGASTFGFDLYRRVDLEAGAAVHLGLGSFRTVAVGIALHRRTAHVRGYGSTGTWASSVGFIVPITPFITLGSSLQNWAVSSSGGSVGWPRALDVGIAFSTGSALVVTAQAAKEVRSPASFAGGVEIGLVPSFVLRGGITAFPRRLSGGAGLRTRHLLLDGAAVRHEALGWSPSISLTTFW